MSDSAHAQRFAQLKEAHGSQYAFHGSPLWNWHSILRSSLRNLSNTELMTTGAAYGAGTAPPLHCQVCRVLPAEN